MKAETGPVGRESGEAPFSTPTPVSALRRVYRVTQSVTDFLTYFFPPTVNKTPRNS